jgi:cytochrome c oxidase subunit IV
MSTSHADHGHGHGNGVDHVPHVLPMKIYLATWGTLLVLTVVTVGASYVNLGHTGNLIVALFIATIKASVVALIFMHLKWDSKFHTIIFIFALLFLAIFIVFTMFDTQYRGEAETVENQHPLDVKAPFEGQQTGDVAVVPKIDAPAPTPVTTGQPGSGVSAPVGTSTPGAGAIPAPPGGTTQAMGSLPSVGSAAPATGSAAPAAGSAAPATGSAAPAAGTAAPAAGTAAPAAGTAAPAAGTATPAAH